MIGIIPFNLCLFRPYHVVQQHQVSEEPSNDQKIDESESLAEVNYQPLKELAFYV